MGVYTFICKKSGKDWSAKQYEGELEGSADNTFDLQRSLVKTALSTGDCGAVQSSFSYVTPSSAVFQVPFSISVSVVLIFCDPCCGSDVGCLILYLMGCVMLLLLIWDFELWVLCYCWFMFMTSCWNWINRRHVLDLKILV